jgi:DNA polymerase-1
MPLTLIFDGHYMLHRCLHQPNLAELEAPDGRRLGGVLGSLRIIRNAVQQFRAKRVVVVWDGGHSSRRMKLFPAYKAHREHDPEDEDDKYYRQVFETNYAALSRMLPWLSCRTIRLPDREADDVCWHMAQTASEQGKVVIVSDDKDYLQAVSDGIHVHRPLSQETVTPENFILSKGSGVPMKWFLLMRAVIGDKSDGIPGVHGVGETTIKQVIAEYMEAERADGVETFRDRMKFYGFCKKHRLARFQHIGSSSGRVERNLTLIDLSQESFSEKEIKLLRDDLQETQQFSDLSVARVLREMAFASIFKSFGHWINPFRMLS